MYEHTIAHFRLPHYCISQYVAFRRRIPGDETLVKCSRTIFYSATTPRTQPSDYDRRCLSTSSTESSSLVMICWMIEWMNEWTMRRRDWWLGENGDTSLRVTLWVPPEAFTRNREYRSRDYWSVSWPEGGVSPRQARSFDLTGAAAFSPPSTEWLFWWKVIEGHQCRKLPVNGGRCTDVYVPIFVDKTIVIVALARTLPNHARRSSDKQWYTIHIKNDLRGLEKRRLGMRKDNIPYDIFLPIFGSSFRRSLEAVAVSRTRRSKKF
jgi:hypothetical protein